MNAADRLPADSKRATLPPGRTRRLWFGILAAPLAWTVVELASVAVANLVCDGSQGPIDDAGLAFLLALSLGAIAVSLYAGIVAYRVFRERSVERDILRSEGRGRVEFMAMAGVLVSGLLLLNIVFFTVIPFSVDPCRRAL